MKYIRTKDGRIIKVAISKEEYEKDYKNSNVSYEEWFGCFCFNLDTIKVANTIEELCDELVVVQKDFRDLLNADTHCLQTLKKYYEINKIEILGIYGAIWITGEHGEPILKSVAEMNEKGELELI